MCALCCAFGLAACDGGSADDSTSSGTPPTELTDAEWTAAFDAANYDNFTQNVVTEETDGDDVEISYSRNKFDVANKRVEMTDYVLDGSQEVMLHGNMLAKIDGKYYSFYYSDGWSKSEMSGYADDDFDEYITRYFGTMAMFGAEKANYTFANDVYSADSITFEPYEGYEVEVTNVKFTFENGKIKTFAYESTNPEDDTQKVKYEAAFTDYGTTVVTIPNVDSGSSQTGKMSEEEWLLNLAAFVTGRNFTLDRTIDGQFSAGMKLEGTTYYERYASGVENYLVIEGREYFRYGTSGNGWVKNTSSEGEYNSYTSFAVEYIGAAVIAFGENYSAFEYMDGTYYASYLDVGYGFVLTDIEVTFNGITLVQVVCTWDDELVTIYDIGTTDIELPQDFVDNTTKGKELSIKEFIALAEQAKDKEYTKVIRTQDSTETKGPYTETYYYGIGDWEYATSGAHLTAEIIATLDSMYTIQSIARNGDSYELVVELDAAGAHIIQVMVVDSDFYMAQVTMTYYFNGNVVRADEITYEWGYATPEELEAQ